MRAVLDGAALMRVTFTDPRRLRDFAFPMSVPPHHQPSAYV